MKLKALLYVPEDDERFHIDILDEDQSTHLAEIYKDKKNKIKITFFRNGTDKPWDTDLRYFIDFLEKSFKEINI